MSDSELRVALDFRYLANPPSPGDIESLEATIMAGCKALQDEGSEIAFERQERPGQSKDAGLIVTGLIVLLGATWWNPEKTGKLLKMLSKEYRRATNHDHVRISLDGDKATIDVMGSDLQSTGELLDLATTAVRNVATRPAEGKHIGFTIAPMDE